MSEGGERLPDLGAEESDLEEKAAAPAEPGPAKPTSEGGERLPDLGAEESDLEDKAAAPAEPSPAKPTSEGRERLPDLGAEESDLEDKAAAPAAPSPAKPTSEGRERLPDLGEPAIERDQKIKIRSSAEYNDILLRLSKRASDHRRIGFYVQITMWCCIALSLLLIVFADDILGSKLSAGRLNKALVDQLNGERTDLEADITRQNDKTTAIKADFDKKFQKLVIFGL